LELPALKLIPREAGARLTMYIRAYTDLLKAQLVQATGARTDAQLEY
tara:strand:+ start:186 stop:326 length:141 start_codon:yes stop_codon:yes gene_type:complete